MTISYSLTEMISLRCTAIASEIATYFILTHTSYEQGGWQKNFQGRAPNKQNTEK